MDQSPARPRLDRSAHRDIFITYLTFVVIMAVVVRFDGLVRRDIWLDESCTHFVVTHLGDWPANGPPVRKEVAHMPYFLLLRGWVAMAGDTAWGLRSFSATVGVAGVVAIALVGASVAGPRVGLIASILLALHPLHIHYSQEARVYCFWVLLATTLLFFLVNAVTKRRRQWWLAYGITAWLTVLTHYYTLLFLPATLAAVLIADNRRTAVRQWLVAHVVLAIALVPVYLLLIRPNAHTGSQLWLQATWAGYPPALAILRSLWALAPSGGYPEYLGLLPHLPELLRPYGFTGPLLSRWAAPAVIVVVGIAYAIAAVGRTSAQGEDHTPVQHNRLATGLVVMVFAFLAVAFAFSALVRPAYVVGRYDLIALPAVLLVTGIIVDAMPTSWHQNIRYRGLVPAAITLALCACCVVSLIGTHLMPVRTGQARRAEKIAAHVSNDDLLITLGMYRWFMQYEWSRIGFAPEIESFPPRHDQQLCWDNAKDELDDTARLAAGIKSTAARIDAALLGGRHVWMLVHGEPNGARFEVDQKFFKHLHESGFTLRPVDEQVGLIELVR